MTPRDTFDGYLDTPFGGLGVSAQGDWVTRIGFVREIEMSPVSRNRAVMRALDQLRRYLDDPRFVLHLPIVWQGTPFQRRVWRVLQQIPVGTTRSYGEVARCLGTSARAVGGACRVNATVLAVPCHRVVAAGGLGGFSGETQGEMPAVKRWLLRHEGAAIDEP